MDGSAGQWQNASIRNGLLVQVFLYYDRFFNKLI